MALGNKGNTGALIILKPVFKVDGQQCKPFFRVTRKTSDGWVSDKDGESEIYLTLH